MFPTAGYGLVMRRGEWVSGVRADPKGQLECDLAVAIAGMVIIALGGIVAVAGLHPRIQSIHDNSPAPLLGNVVAALMILLGLMLAAVNLVIWMTGRH
jgi:hypothetical protein